MMADERPIQPVNCPVTQEFGNIADWDPDFYAQWGYPGHNGRDYGCPAGTLGGAILSGKLDKIAFEEGGFGQYARQDCGDVWVYYCHLTRNGILAGVGEMIAQGQKFYKTGWTGAVYPKGELGAHLHLGLRLKSYPKTDPWKGWRDPFGPTPFLKGENGEGDSPTPGPSPFSKDENGEGGALRVDAPRLPVVRPSAAITRWINLRSEPRQSALDIGNIYPGERLRVLEIHSDAEGNLWYLVLLKSSPVEAGWAAARWMGETWLVADESE